MAQQIKPVVVSMGAGIENKLPVPKESFKNFAELKYLSGKELFANSNLLYSLIQSYITIFKGKPFFETLSLEEVKLRLEKQLSNERSGVILAFNEANEIVGFATLQILPYNKLLERLSTALHEYTQTFLPVEEMAEILDRNTKTFSDIKSLVDEFGEGAVIEEIAVEEGYRKGPITIPFIRNLLKQVFELSGNKNVPGFMWTANKGSMYDLASGSAMRQIGEFAVLSRDQPGKHYVKGLFGTIENGLSQEIYPLKEGEFVQGKTMAVYAFNVDQLEKATRYGEISVKIHMFNQSPDKWQFIKDNKDRLVPKFVRKYLKRSSQEG